MLVRELREAGFGCHLATNQDDLRASYMRARMGYDELLDRCFYSCEVGAAKPDEEFFRRVAAELGVELRELVFVDDTLENVDAARSCGLPAVFWHHRDGVDALRDRLAEHGVGVVLMATAKSPAVEIEVDDKVVRVSNPDRVYFPARGETKLDLVEYYLSVGDGIVNALRERPCMLHRFPTGVTGEKVHQKRLPKGAPPWMETVRVFFPRWSRTADELCVTELAQVIWAVQMSTVEFHPWNSRRADTEKPDEWRIDLDPGPLCPWETVQRVAHVAHEVLDDLGATGFPKTSGGKGMHIYVRIRPDHGFKDVRRAALAFAREVERRSEEVTTTWWRKDRDPHDLFVDYNQNARDHTIAAAYSVRGNEIATVSAPVHWEEIDDCHPDDFTIATMPARFAELGDLHAGIDDAVFDIARCWSGPSATRRPARSRPPTRRSEPNSSHRSTSPAMMQAWNVVRASAREGRSRLAGALGGHRGDVGVSSWLEDGIGFSRSSAIALLVGVPLGVWWYHLYPRALARRLVALLALLSCGW